MADNRVLCLGREEETCLCDMCLDRKLQLLREAAPDVQRSILLHLPPDDVVAAPPAPPPPPPPSTLHPIPSSMGEAQPRSPNRSSSSSLPAVPTTTGAGSTPSTGSRPQLHLLSLFKVPLWPTHSDAEFDEARTPPRNPPPSVFSDIIIPPLVQQRIPTIQDCINYVITNANITGPRKEAAIVEAIDEILVICERQLMKERIH